MERSLGVSEKPWKLFKFRGSGLVLLTPASVSCSVSVFCRGLELDMDQLHECVPSGPR